MNKNLTIGIIGAGPAGLTAGYELAKKGFNVTVFESQDSVGGMSKTIKLWGQLVDLGPHRFFSKDTRVNKLWLEIVRDNYSMVNRLTRIYYNDNFFYYPLKAFNVLRGLGIFNSILCIISYLKSKILKKKDTSTFDTWVSDKFGERLFNIFFKSYSEKLWGIDCKEIDSDFAIQRIKKLSFFEAVKSIFAKKNSLKHKTLVDEFAYPHLGTGDVYNRMSKKIVEFGGKIFLNSQINQIKNDSLSDKFIIKTVNGDNQIFDKLISSMPITKLIELLNAPIIIQNYAKALTFRNTILVYLRINKKKLFPDQWIYVHSNKLRTGRITNFRNWVDNINCGLQDTIVCLEYWCNNSDQIWIDDKKDLINLAKNEITKILPIKINDITDGEVVRIPKCYPVYKTGYKKYLKPIEEFLSKKKNLSIVGRYGAFKYNNQDHSILMGILAAENISDNKNHNLWEINNDYIYQEETIIEATGLKKI
jgi:protoporphyrinogen oxidase